MRKQGARAIGILTYMCGPMHLRTLQWLKFTGESIPRDSMAASSGDDIPAQLAALLGNKSVRIRKTDETPPRVSVVDVISAISGRSANQAAEQLRRLIERYPDVKANCFDVKFPDARGRKGQKGTATSDATGIVDIIMLLQGKIQLVCDAKLLNS